MTTQKAYVIGVNVEHEQTSSTVHMGFDSGSEKAFVWETRGRAEYACREYESYEVTIPARGNRMCRDFTVEQLAPQRFVVFCHYPS